MAEVCVAGLGYIGLPTAAMLASQGHQVTGFDINAAAVASIKSGHPHFHEPDLQMLLSAALSTGRLKVQTDPVAADYFILAVPTPLVEGNKPDLSYVNAACDGIAPFLRVGSTVILESTSPVGTTERLCERIAAARPDLRVPRYMDVSGEFDIFVCHCPERILPGQMLRELVSNDRIIGGVTDACAQSGVALYETFVRSNLLVTDCRTAEFVKLIENASRDINIAFANELSMICDHLGIDVWDAINLANRHPRVKILQPGPGVGGHCIAVDPWFIVDSAPNLSRMIRVAREVNDRKPKSVVESVRALAKRFKRPIVSCYGLTYKADVDDLRESPALEIVHDLARTTNLNILVCEPHVRKLPPALESLSNVRLVGPDEARREADIVVFLVGHQQFRRLEANAFLNKVVVDTIGLLGGSHQRQRVIASNGLPVRTAADETEQRLSA
ncbi:UDP-N-acetyl-D-mannosamine dehydrogenase [Microvirga terricola]|uniref:UDP-N-acetyl-D-mannosamine dehydrogenase n=1 Tax=Microvirga terricola TaxID=2719797 RepID=A0ABX0V774_9HYPH|nr:UDP-N-acetyl-D-mannosamine dehydrogenase [Microvirga terricola]NIX75700.1 UDP-N-acetyl-D-mannosamine dehydrogenase [Microvirga terricola]